MTAYPGQTRTMLGQFCASLWDSQSWPDMTEPGFDPGTIVTPLSLGCSAFDNCATREPHGATFVCVSSHSPLFRKVYFYMLFQSNFLLA
jgi:hypothetical protein